MADDSSSNQQQSDGQAGTNKRTNQDDDGSKKKRPILDRSLGSAAGLSKLLPTGTTLAFQTMAPSFTRGGECNGHDVNFAFTCGLIVFLTLLSAALNFTDSITGKDDGRTIHYGVVTSRGLRLFNGGALVRESKVDKLELRKRRRRPEDVLHAVVSAAVFLALAFCDAGVQGCLIKKKSRPWKDFFNHLPLAVGFLATFLFIIFPTTRKGIGEDGGGAWGGAGEKNAGSSTSTEVAKKTKKEELEERKAKTLLGAAATLSKLLPTGTTLAFQTMAPSFTNGGECTGHRVNFAFTWGLIGLLTLMCAVLSFTDSVTDPDGHTHYGLATPKGIALFNHAHTPKNLRERDDWERVCRAKSIRPRDFLHAVVSAAVFVALAFCDAGVQGCLVPEDSTQWREFLTLLPLAVAFLASFLFVIFPSDRKGIGEEGGDDFWHLDTTTMAAEPKAGSDEGQQGPVVVDQLFAVSPAGQHHHNQISCSVCVRG